MKQAQSIFGWRRFKTLILRVTSLSKDKFFLEAFQDLGKF